MELTTVWFIAIAVLWTGYLVLEGFDFGVGMLLAVLAQNDRERRVLINTIGPVWDANEVWVIVAIGATFAAFPEWYATMLSGFYLPLLLILVALIVRIVGLEFRSKRADVSWRRRCDAAIVFGSVVPAVAWGLVLANLLRGTPVDADGEAVGGVVDLLSPYAVLGGLVTAAVFLVHGAFFVALKTVGPIRQRATSLALRAGLPAAAGLLVFLGWTAATQADRTVWLLAAGSFAAFVAAFAAGVGRLEGWAFGATAGTILLLVATVFSALFPDVMVSSLDPAWSLTTESAAASPYTLRILTWVAVFFVPVVLAYQGWSYWVFRRRIGVQHIPEARPSGSR